MYEGADFQHLVHPWFDKANVGCEKSQENIKSLQIHKLGDEGGLISWRGYGEY